MGKYFTLFPKVPYQIDKGEGTRVFQLPTNLLVRVRVILENLDAYYNYDAYDIREGDTPEIVAEKYYGDPELHWLVMMANNIIDPHYDWPLNWEAFNKHIRDKYGSIETAQTTYHHYEEIHRTIDQSTETIQDTKIQISAGDYANTAASMGSPTIYTVGSSTVARYMPYRNAVTNYDWEQEENEKRRSIRLIRPAYVGDIVEEFKNIMEKARGDINSRKKLRSVR